MLASEPSPPFAAPGVRDRAIPRLALAGAVAVLALVAARPSAALAACGDGILDVGEACDDGNTLDGDCCSSTCTIEPSTVVCRAAASACDVAETCDGVSGACPPDAAAPDTTPCDDGSFCSIGDHCQAGVCVAGGPGNAGQVCRTAAGPCDVAETCDGVSIACPADQLRPSTVVCRSAQGQCDLAETCTGTSAACPADAKSTALCRPPSGPCDVAEVCDGVSNFCPTNLFAPNGTLCSDDGLPCTADLCSSGVCTHAPGNAGLVCRAASGSCDVAETCNGASSTCPSDVKAIDGSSCSDGLACTTNDHCQAGVCTGTTSGCGDGVVACGEQCDDGNAVSGDGCSSTCQVEAGGEVCNDLIDNEPDGKFDCDDPDCNCPPLVNGGVPSRTSRLIVKRGLDLVKLQGAMHPTTSFDPASEKFGLLITNANGRVYSAVVPAGQIQRVGDGTWVYRGRAAKLSGGIFTLKLRQASTPDGTVVRFSLVATGELSGATLPQMTTEVVLGDDVAAKSVTWTQLRTGWKGTLP